MAVVTQAAAEDATSNGALSELLKAGRHFLEAGEAFALSGDEIMGHSL